MRIKRLIGLSLIKIGDITEQLQFLFRRTALKLLMLALGFFLGFGVCAKMYHSETIEKQKVEEFITKIINSSRTPLVAKLIVLVKPNIPFVIKVRPIIFIVL